MSERGADIEILSQETGEYLKMLKSINEAIETSLERETNPDKTSKERGHRVGRSLNWANNALKQTTIIL